jgi:ADP-L-glycero-D-manno-heptose 6-epimerase
MIMVTGGAGFIGSAFLWKLNQQGRDDLVVVDVLDATDKWRNLVHRRFADYWDHRELLGRIETGKMPKGITALVHMGACSSTTERDSQYLMQNNTLYTRALAEWALAHGVRFIYASSGATYGDGSQGYSDDDAVSERLSPLNMYGYSKQLFDLWAIRTGAAKAIAGLKFFNVYGPNEYHKGEMRSVIHKAFGQIQDTGTVKLFKSYRPEVRDGEQVRDFVYVKDAVEVLSWLLEHPQANGIFNVGTGQARTWNDLVAAVFAALKREPRIDYIEMPAELRDRYQYRTEADIRKLQTAGFNRPFATLEAGVTDYVKNYLTHADPYL